MAKALLLFSEGLDSTLSGLILKREGIEVIALRFITPFFGWRYKASPHLFEEKVKALGLKAGIVVDLTEEYLERLQKPAFGYGDYANPCIDCKVLFLKKAKDLMEELKADFLASGEVVGQRPMSQNRVTLEKIEREAGVEGLLLRPLSALLLKETIPEKRGLIPREKLYAQSGRKRDLQLELAKTFGLKEIPTPAGGCLLADPIIGSRVLRVLKEKRPLNPLTAELITFGRHYFESSLWLILGRNEKENLRLEEVTARRLPLYTLSEPSPYLAVIEGPLEEDKIKELLLRHSKKARLRLQEGKRVDLIKL
jgi:hypothetical protein